jgi:uncharacterized protein (TIGR03083 family)
MRRTQHVEDILWASHRRLADVVSASTDAQLQGPSYCADWTTAQVLSHMGSGSEIFGLLLEAGLAGEDPPPRETYQAIWDRWNAMAPDEQARSSVDANQAFLDRVAATDDDRLNGLEFTMFGGPADAERLLSMRAYEHAVHSWDVMVIADPTATIAPDATELMVDGLDRVASRSGKPGGRRIEASIAVTDPKRSLRLSVGDDVHLTSGRDDADAVTTTARISTPAEALIRLVYGRLDREHTPSSVVSEGVELEDLRAVFTGF